MAHSELDTVLITAPLIEPTSKTPMVGLRTTYTEMVTKQHMHPLIVHQRMDRQALLRAYTRSSALISTGGLDWNSASYDQKPEKETQTPDDERDAMELFLLTLALQDKKPILGICRGEQGLAIAVHQLLGRICSESVLIQHLPHITQYRHGVSSYEELTDPGHQHIVQILPGTQLQQIFPETEYIEPSSGHHQAVNKKAIEQMSILKLSAISSPDDIVEAIEVDTKEHPFAIGTQFHPEVNAAIAYLIMSRLRSQAYQYSLKDTLFPLR